MNRLVILIWAWALLVTGLFIAGRHREYLGRSAKSQKELAERWLAAVAGGEEETAIALANEIVPRAPAATNPEYAALAGGKGIDPQFLDLPFNIWDFQLWHDALFFKQLAQELSSGPADIPALFGAVVRRIQPYEKKAGSIPWPREIWRRGWGVCDRQVWALLELAYQEGWETVVVYLMDPKKKTSPHTVGELRKPGSVYFADPLYRTLLPNKSVNAVAADDAVLRVMWPGHDDLRVALDDPQFFIPSHPQDYRPRNQLLYTQLMSALGDRSPRFGADPKQRLKLYNTLQRSDGSLERGHLMWLWFYPFDLLREDMQLHERAGTNGGSRGQSGGGPGAGGLHAL